MGSSADITSWLFLLLLKCNKRRGCRGIALFWVLSFVVFSVCFSEFSLFFVLVFHLPNFKRSDKDFDNHTLCMIDEEFKEVQGK